MLEVINLNIDLITVFEMTHTLQTSRNITVAENVHKYRSFFEKITALLVTFSAVINSSSIIIDTTSINNIAATSVVTFNIDSIAIFSSLDHFLLRLEVRFRLSICCLSHNLIMIMTEVNINFQLFAVYSVTFHHSIFFNFNRQIISIS